MGDDAYDAIIIGGGTNSLVTAIYLAKYGGMKVGVFEDRHEMGGGLSSQESPAPGFIGDSHASTLRAWYYEPVRQDFPDFEEKGGKLTHYTLGRAIIRKEDHACFGVYHKDIDPSGERTASELERFANPRDAEIYHKLLQQVRGQLMDAIMETACNLPPPPGEKTAIHKWVENWLAQPDCPVDHRFTRMNPYRVLHELFDEKALIYMLLREIIAGATCVDRGTGMNVLTHIAFAADTCYAIGGTHSIAHAYQRILSENGGKYHTGCTVKKILVKNGKAQGIRLADETEIAARKVVVSGVDVFQLCFDLLGREHTGQKILRKVENLERSGASTITWYTWAVTELPDYKAANFNPDINDAHWLMLGDRNPEYLLEEVYWRRLGKIPPGDAIVVFGHHSSHDSSRAPEGLHVLSTEEEVPPAYCLTEKQWMQFKRDHADKTIRVLREYAPNMSWDKVIGFDPITAYDTAQRNRSMSYTGSFGIIDRVAGQNYPYVPVPEMADYRTPVKGLYATGVCWGLFGGAGVSFPGYSCYKAIADDFDLGKPWKEKERSW